MKEWKLIRIRDSYVADIRYSETQPPFSRSFGRPIEFRWESRDLTAAEWNFIRQSFRRDRLPELIGRFIDAYYEERVLGDPTEMNQLMARIGQIRGEDP